MFIIPLAVALCADAFFVGISVGLKQIRLSWGARGMIGLISMAMTFVSVSLGSLIARCFSEQAGNRVGCVLLLVVGCWLLFGDVLKREVSARFKGRRCFSLISRVLNSSNRPVQILKHPHEGDADASGLIDTKEGILMGIALSIDTLASGAALGVAQVSPLLLALLVGVMQTGFLSLGQGVSGKIVKLRFFSDRLCASLSGAILILVSILRII